MSKLIEFFGVKKLTPKEMAHLMRLKLAIYDAEDNLKNQVYEYAYSKGHSNYEAIKLSEKINLNDSPKIMQKSYSNSDKINYYKKRANDNALTKAQREFAKKRLMQLR